jgi:hypothetical protein
MRKPILLLTLILLLMSASNAQNAVDETEDVVLPDAVMTQVVSRIIRWKFKPSRTPKKIPVSNRSIKREYLPTIPNLEFELVPDADAETYEKDILIFEDIERLSDSQYTINVGWGEPGCFASGETWKFSVKSDRVRLWPTGAGWGRGCGGDGPRPVRGLSVGDVSPNELPGYEFFAKGKLNGIRLGVSKREDMIKIFGDTCEGAHDYDENWDIWVNYFSDDPKSFGTVTQGKESYAYRPKPELVGTLRFVRLTPKKRISFSGFIFSRRFGTLTRMAIGDAWDENGFAGAAHSRITSYLDGYGLSYEIFDQETFNNLRDKPKVETKLQKGDLVGIEYEIPDSLDERIYDKFPIPPK